MGGKSGGAPCDGESTRLAGEWGCVQRLRRCSLAGKRLVRREAVPRLCALGCPFKESRPPHADRGAAAPRDGPPDAASDERAGALATPAPSRALTRRAPPPAPRPPPRPRQPLETAAAELRARGGPGFVRFRDGAKTNIAVANLEFVSLAQVLANLDAWAADWDEDMTAAEVAAVRAPATRAELRRLLQV